MHHPHLTHKGTKTQRNCFFHPGLHCWWVLSVFCRQYRRPRFSPWVRNIPWRRKWRPTPVFLPEESHGERFLAGYNPWDPKESDRTEKLTLSFFKKWPISPHVASQGPPKGRKLSYCPSITSSITKYLNTTIIFSQLFFFSHLVMSDFLTPWTEAHQASLSLIISCSLPRFMSIE